MTVNSVIDGDCARRGDDEAKPVNSANANNFIAGGLKMMITFKCVVALLLNKIFLLEFVVRFLVCRVGQD